jgi:hypothetical protein
MSCLAILEFVTINSKRAKMATAKKSIDGS